MKRAPAKPIKLSPEEIRAIELAVFSVVEKQLDAKFYLLAVDFEKEAGFWYLRIYVEGKQEAISLSDCEQISRALDPLLDELPELQDYSYSLEVSSPGLFRPLKTEREFAFYQGRVLRVETRPPAGKGKSKAKAAAQAPLRSEEGLLQAYDAQRGVVTLQRMDSVDRVEVALDADTVAFLNPVIRFPDEHDAVNVDGTD